MAPSMRLPHYYATAAVLALAMVCFEMKKVHGIEAEISPMPAMAAGSASPSTVAYAFNAVFPLLCTFGFQGFFMS
ncbi:hypothetical protein SDJN03_21585, partial [Cucurbita argyrosperma subsp. sororia]